MSYQMQIIAEAGVQHSIFERFTQRGLSVSIYLGPPIDKPSEGTRITIAGAVIV